MKNKVLALTWMLDGNTPRLDAEPLERLLDDGYQIIRADIMPGTSAVGGLYCALPPTIVYVLRKDED